MDVGYARVSTTKQDLGRQLTALEAVGIPVGQIHVDKKSGTTTARSGLTAALAHARAGLGSGPGIVGTGGKGALMRSCMNGCFHVLTSPEEYIS
ncbi:recombinase family protein [Arthrobacter sp. TMN-49]